MTSSTLWIKSVSRLPATGPEDSLDFKTGVNVMVGPPNTGKTAWLRMVDYLWGDPDKPEDAFGADLAEKYGSMRAVINVAGTEMLIERRWKEKGKRGKVFVNEEAIQDSDFSAHLLKRLQIPILHFPQGNPFSARTWPELSWRQMMRHIYRQERFWGELAQRQLDVQQHAVVALFLGVGEKLFPDELGRLVAKRKEASSLEARLEGFRSVLCNSFMEITGREISQAALGVEEIYREIENRETSISTNITQRDELVQSLRPREEEATQPLLAIEQALRSHRVTVVQKIAEAEAALAGSSGRLRELIEYRTSLDAELDKIRRTKVAGRLLGALRVTHCPVCDQEVSPPTASDGKCYLCHRPHVTSTESLSAAENRLDFEAAQHAEERGEVDELISEIERELAGRKESVERLQHELDSIDSQLRPFQSAVASILPPSLGLLDAQRGTLEEQLRQLRRMREALQLGGSSEELAGRLEKDIDALASEVDRLASQADFEHANRAISKGMNEYLDILNKGDRRRWPKGTVEFELRERSFSIKVDGAKWSAVLGGTLKVFLFLAYHYGLMSLVRGDGFHYPGISILDFPATLGEGHDIVRAENYLLEPYVRLLAEAPFADSQVIFAGHAFRDLPDSHRVEFTKVWR